MLFVKVVPTKTQPLKITLPSAMWDRIDALRSQQKPGVEFALEKAIAVFIAKQLRKIERDALTAQSKARAIETGPDESTSA